MKSIAAGPLRIWPIFFRDFPDMSLSSSLSISYDLRQGTFPKGSGNSPEKIGKPPGLPSEVNKRGRPSKWPPECLPSNFADFECAFSLYFLGENMTPKDPFLEGLSGKNSGGRFAPGRFCSLPVYLLPTWTKLSRRFVHQSLFGSMTNVELFSQNPGWPQFGSVRLQFVQGTVAAVPVFDSDGSFLERAFVVSVQF